MSQILELNVPDELASRARLEAEQSSRPLQAVLIDWLHAGADDLESLPDHELLAVCDATMNAAQQTELSELLAANRDGTLEVTSRRRLATLMGGYQQGLLRKARAWRIAVARGLRSSLD